MKKLVFIIFIALVSCSNKLMTGEQKIATNKIVSRGEVEKHTPTKHALIIAIGDYPDYTGWSKISSKNDVDIIKQSLNSQGFKDDNIKELIDDEAKYQDIINAFEALKKRIKPDDILVIHISSHGQQIKDNGIDEIDGLDEAIIPYDAEVEYKYNYHGENHLRDDELGKYITQFRNILGDKGQVLLISDSCHSGTVTRGSKVRGTDRVFKKPTSTITKNDKPDKGSDLFEYDKKQLKSNHAKFVLISGAKADEKNWEHKGYGSLSFAFSYAINQMDPSKPKISYRQLFAEIEKKMGIIAKNQTPVIEGDQDWQLFGDEKLDQDPYFSIKNVEEDNLIYIQAGKIQGLFENTTIFLFPKGTVKVKPKEAIATGKITKTWFNESSIELDKTIPNLKKDDYWVFIDKKEFSDIKLDVFIDDTNIDNEFVDSIKAYISEKNLGIIPDKAALADVIIYKEDNDIKLTTADGFELYKTKKNRGEDELETIKEKLSAFAQSQFLQSIELNNESFKFDFRFVPVTFDKVNKQIKDTLNYKDYISEDGIFQVVAKKDYVRIEVTNNSDKPIYFNVLEIYNNGSLNPLLNTCNTTLDEMKIPPTGKPVYLCAFRFAPPYEKITLKAFATDYPIDLSFLVKSRGNTRGKPRGNLNPFEKFIANSYIKTRGPETVEERPEIDGFSKTFVYEIVKE